MTTLQLLYVVTIPIAIVYIAWDLAVSKNWKIAGVKWSICLCIGFFLKPIMQTLHIGPQYFIFWVVALMLLAVGIIIKIKEK